MKWLLTSTLSLVLVLGGCSASTTNNIANAEALIKLDAKTKIATAPKTALNYKYGLFPDTKITLTMLERDAVHSAKIQTNSIRMGKMLAYVKTRIHKTPYVFSGISPKYGWDCSGLVRWFYQQGFGITLEHSATAQGYAGHRVSKQNAKAGDIVVFGWKGYSGFYHASIYVGNNQVINANKGSGTTIIEPLSDYKGSRIVFVRLVETLYPKTS
jgi:hypothetical protein